MGVPNVQVLWEIKSRIARIVTHCIARIVTHVVVISNFVAIHCIRVWLLLLSVVWLAGYQSEWVPGTAETLRHGLVHVHYNFHKLTSLHVHTHKKYNYNNNTVSRSQFVHEYAQCIYQQSILYLYNTATFYHTLYIGTCIRYVTFHVASFVGRITQHLHVVKNVLYTASIPTAALHTHTHIIRLTAHLHSM